MQFGIRILNYVIQLFNQFHKKHSLNSWDKLSKASIKAAHLG